ncbi:MAG: hypothetical protein LBT57_01350 [Puniceicoccales bacterium]|jgi:hypothetical protein|nr:hypothetical protein [Puniceicoccales bacterium]
MSAAFKGLTWCIAHLGDDGNWWVDSLSDETHWDMDRLGLIDPRQWEYLLELLSPLRDCGLQDELLEAAFCQFRIEKELPNRRVQLTVVNTCLADTDEKLFLLPYAQSDSEEAYTEWIDHLLRLRVESLNRISDFRQPLSSEEVEMRVLDRENRKTPEGRVHAFEEIASILEYVPEEEEEEKKEGDLEEEDSGEGVSDLGEELWEKELQEDIGRLELSE